jgi:hypothetical protein
MRKPFRGKGSPCQKPPVDAQRDIRRVSGKVVSPARFSSIFGEDSMYQAKVRNPFSPESAKAPDDVEAAMWDLFVAIGEFWQTGDDSQPYRKRLVSFMANRVALNPLYANFYRAAAAQIDRLIRDHGREVAYQKLFTDKPRQGPVTLPDTELEFIQQFVVNEFIALRMALGSFQTYGALNYPGYFGGANIPGQPVPYRTF